MEEFENKDVNFKTEVLLHLKLMWVSEQSGEGG